MLMTKITTLAANVFASLRGLHGLDGLLLRLARSSRRCRVLILLVLRPTVGHQQRLVRVTLCRLHRIRLLSDGLHLLVLLIVARLRVWIVVLHVAAALANWRCQRRSSRGGCYFFHDNWRCCCRCRRRWLLNHRGGHRRCCAVGEQDLLNRRQRYENTAALLDYRRLVDNLGGLLLMVLVHREIHRVELVNRSLLDRLIDREILKKKNSVLVV